MIRQLFHAIFAVLIWVVFVYYWSLVIRRPMNPDTKMALTALAVLTAITTVVLWVWVYHNIRLHRKFRDRRRARRQAVLPDHDYLGRPLVLKDADELLRAGRVEVVVIGSWINGRYIEQKAFKPTDAAEVTAP